MSPGAPGRVILSPAGLRIRHVGKSRDAIVFIHGLGASLRYWGRAYDSLAEGRSLVFVDLLGFGGSLKPDEESYSLEAHAGAVAGSVAELGLNAKLIVGHSTGGLVSMAVGAGMPDAHVITFGAPLFQSAAAARRHLRRLGLMARLMVDESPWAARMCRMMCEHRDAARRLAPLFAPALPNAVAADGMNHIWRSYEETFASMLAVDGRSLCLPVDDRLTLVYGDADNVAPVRRARKTLSGLRAEIVVEAGDHHLPVGRPEACRTIIRSHAYESAVGRTMPKSPLSNN